jgi:hypothetical protein
MSDTMTITPLCYTDIDEAPWRCPNPAAYELVVASVASHTLMLCVECTANYRRDWPDDVIEVRTLRASTPPIRGISITRIEPVEAGA